MKVHDIAQRTPDWHALRRGKLTASAFGMFIANPDKDATSRKAWQNAIDTMIGDEADGDDTDPGYEDYWMRRGTRMEPEAIAAYEEYTGHHVDQFGFIEHASGLFGCSPDGMIFDRSGTDAFDIDPVTGHELYRGRLLHGLEMKCPKGSTQRKRNREKVLPDEYRCQVHGSMAITGAAYWDFWSWHPKLPPLHVRVERDSFTEQLLAGLLKLEKEYRRQREQVAEEWEAHFAEIERRKEAA